VAKLLFARSSVRDHQQLPFGFSRGLRWSQDGDRWTFPADLDESGIAVGFSGHAIAVHRRTEERARREALRLLEIERRGETRRDPLHDALCALRTAQGTLVGTVERCVIVGLAVEDSAGKTVGGEPVREVNHLRGQHDRAA